VSASVRRARRWTCLLGEGEVEDAPEQVVGEGREPVSHPIIPRQGAARRMRLWGSECY
jgi:hypothetical protein